VLALPSNELLRSMDEKGGGSLKDRKTGRGKGAGRTKGFADKYFARKDTASNGGGGRHAPTAGFSEGEIVEKGNHEGRGVGVAGGASSMSTGSSQSSGKKKVRRKKRLKALKKEGQGGKG